MPATIGETTSYFWYCSECCEGDEDYDNEVGADEGAHDHNVEHHADA